MGCQDYSLWMGCWFITCRVTPSSKSMVPFVHLYIWTKGGTGNISGGDVGLKKKKKETQCGATSQGGPKPGPCTLNNMKTEPLRLVCTLTQSIKKDNVFKK